MKYFSVILMLLFFAFRLYYIGKVELSQDECYYWEWSRNLDYCYMDQGPVLGFAIFVFTKLFGSSTEFTVRFAAVLSGLVTSFISYLFIVKIFKSELAGLLGILLLNLIPFTSIGQMLITHDNLQILFWALSCYLFYRIIYLNHNDNTSQNKFRNYILWAFLGIAIGLNIMSKYTGALFLMCMFLYMISNQFIRKYLRKKEFYICLFFVFIVCLPAIVWNIKNNFATYQYLSGPVVFKPLDSISLKNLIEFVITQIALITPIIFFLFLYAILYPQKSTGHQVQPYISWLLFSSLPVLLFFTLFSAFAKVQENWAACGYFGIIILSAGVIERILKKGSYLSKMYVLTGYISCFVITTITLIHLVYPFIDSFTFGDDKIRGWRTLAKEVSKIMDRYQSKPFLMSNYYWVAAKLAFYTDKQYRVECVNVGLPLRQYALWSDLTKLKTQDAIYVKQNEGIEEEVIKIFNKVELVQIINVPIRKIRDREITYTFSVYHCHNLR